VLRDQKRFYCIKLAAKPLAPNSFTAPGLKRKTKERIKFKNNPRRVLINIWNKSEG